MRIDNRSNTHTEWFYPILDFITQSTKYSSLGTLYIDESNDEFTHGMAHKTNPELSDINLVAPSLVELWIRSDAKYPCVTEHVLGPLMVYSKDEEVVLVLSHELSHLDQFYGYPVSYNESQNHESEEAAERFAINMLGRWRAYRNFGIS